MQANGISEPGTTFALVTLNFLIYQLESIVAVRNLVILSMWPSDSTSPLSHLEHGRLVKVYFIIPSHGLHRMVSPEVLHRRFIHGHGIFYQTYSETPWQGDSKNTSFTLLYLFATMQKKQEYTHICTYITWLIYLPRIKIYSNNTYCTIYGTKMYVPSIAENPYLEWWPLC
jgi:hypothetical protein